MKLFSHWWKQIHYLLFLLLEDSSGNLDLTLGCHENNPTLLASLFTVSFPIYIIAFHVGVLRQGFTLQSKSGTFSQVHVGVSEGTLGLSQLLLSCGHGRSRLFSMNSCKRSSKQVAERKNLEYSSPDPVSSSLRSSLRSLAVSQSWMPGYHASPLYTFFTYACL